VDRERPHLGLRAAIPWGRGSSCTEPSGPEPERPRC
jgi:hypothetical protein